MLFFQTIIFYFIGNFDEIPYEIKNFKKISTHLLTMLTNGAKIQSNKGKVLKEKRHLCPRPKREQQHLRNSPTVLIQTCKCHL